MLLPWLHGHALAANVGQVTHTSGLLFALRGQQRLALNQHSNLENGDTIITEKTTYARLKFIDNSEVTLRPNSQFVVHNFQYQPDKPQQDAAQLGLVKGGLRTLTGLIGKRSTPDSYQMQTPTATIGIRGTDYQLSYDGIETRASVNDGRIQISTPQQHLELEKGQAALIRQPQAPIERIPNTTQQPAIPFTPPSDIATAIGNNTLAPPSDTRAQQTDTAAPPVALPTGHLSCEVR